MLDRPLLATYVFVHEQRATLARMLRETRARPRTVPRLPAEHRQRGDGELHQAVQDLRLEKYGPQKKYFVTFENAFHGRTMGAQLAGGIERQKRWMVDRDPSFVQVPFPDGYKNEDTSFDLFLATLRQRGVEPAQIAGVMTESYQGVGPDFLPVEYAQKLEAFCREHDIVLTMDEVQAGFGRTGKMFCFEHYGITPDLIACGKGITSSLPISAVIGRADIMELYPPGSMTSTHSASPLPVAAAIANLEILREGEA